MQKAAERRAFHMTARGAERRVAQVVANRAQFADRSIQFFGLRCEGASSEPRIRSRDEERKTAREDAKSTKGQRRQPGPLSPQKREIRRVLTAPTGTDFPWWDVSTSISPYSSVWHPKGSCREEGSSKGEPDSERLGEIRSNGRVFRRHAVAVERGNGVRSGSVCGERAALEAGTKVGRCGGTCMLQTRGRANRAGRFALARSGNRVVRGTGSSPARSRTRYFRNLSLLLGEKNK